MLLVVVNGWNCFGQNDGENNEKMMMMMTTNDDDYDEYTLKANFTALIAP